MSDFFLILKEIILIPIFFALVDSKLKNLLSLFKTKVPLVDILLVISALSLALSFHSCS